MTEPAINSAITDVSFHWPDLSEIWRVLTFSAGYNSAIVVLGATLLGFVAGLIGTFAMFRRRAMIGDAIAHSALPGLVASYLLTVHFLGLERSLSILLVGAAFSGVLGVISVQLVRRHSRLAEDAAIGAVLSTFFGFGVVLLSVVQNLGGGSAGGLQVFIYGQTAAMQMRDALLILTVAILVAVVVMCFLKELRLICFDEAFAAALGWPVGSLDFLLMTLVVVVIVVGLQAVGLLLIIALLIIPPAAARFWSDRLSVVTFSSGAIGALSGYLGSCLSALLPRMPAGSVIVLTAGLVFMVSFFCAPSRGVIAQILLHLNLRLRVSQDHLLRFLYELSNPQDSQAENGVSSRALRQRLGRGVILDLALWNLVRRGLVRINQSLIELTEVGYLESRQLARNHQLWGEYVSKFGLVSAGHVDYSADIAEHVLSEEIVSLLELSLAARKAQAELDFGEDRAEEKKP